MAEGYSWSIRRSDAQWRWSISGPTDGRVILGGVAPTRAVAAALVIRAIAQGMTADVAQSESLAA